MRKLNHLKQIVTVGVYAIFVLSFLLFSEGCSDKEAFIQTPELAIDPTNVLRAIVTFRTVKPARADIIIKSDSHSFAVQSSGELATNHSIYIIGLQAQKKYAVTINALDEDGNSHKYRSLSLKTKSLPKDFPLIQVIVSQPEKMQPGITIFNVKRSRSQKEDGGWGLLIGVNMSGDVVWYHREEEYFIHFVTKMRNGNLLYLCGRRKAVELNLRGETVREWDSEKVLSDSLRKFHHDILEMPSGNFLVLSKETRTIGGYYQTKAPRDVYNRYLSQIILVKKYT